MDNENELQEDKNKLGIGLLLPKLDDSHWDDHCKMCGSKFTEIRGRYPNQEPRKICATCTYERLENIREIVSPDYGKAYQNID